MEERKAIARLLIDSVFVRAERNGKWAEIKVNWVGGQTSYRKIQPPVSTLRQMENHEALLTEIHRLRSEGFTQTTSLTSSTLTDGRHLCLKGALTISWSAWCAIVTERHLAGHNVRPAAIQANGGSEIRQKELAMSSITLCGWTRRGWLRCRRVKVRGRWVAVADKYDLIRLRQLRESHAWEHEAPFLRRPNDPGGDALWNRDPCAAPRYRASRGPELRGSQLVPLERARLAPLG